MGKGLSSEVGEGLSSDVGEGLSSDVGRGLSSEKAREEPRGFAAGLSCALCVDDSESCSFALGAA